MLCIRLNVVHSYVVRAMLFTMKLLTLYCAACFGDSHPSVKNGTLVCPSLRMTKVLNFIFCHVMILNIVLDLLRFLISWLMMF